MPFDVIIYWALAALLATGAAAAAAFRIIPLFRIRKSAAAMPGQEDPQEECGTISAVVYSRDCGDRLREYLQELAKQDCGNFETIVVVDSDEPDIQTAVSRMSEEFPDVHMTFIPPVTYHLSRRKLAFMLGIKAAKGEIVVTTSSACTIISESWLREITSGFSDPGTGLVLGLALPDPRADRGAGRLYRQFDTVLSASLSIYAAMRRKPVRGNIFNMAFRRSLFFRINGFSPSNFLHSGDLGIKDEDGNYRITGRIKDMIIRGGENIYPREIEEFLYKLDGVKDVQVAGIPSKKYGEAVGAFIILQEGVTMQAEDVRDFCRNKISRYKIPKYIFFVNEFPMTGSGKIQKFRLKDLGLQLCKEQGIEII